MKILVLGSSGRLGNYITNFLLDNNYQVLGHLRNNKQDVNFNKKIEFMHIDINTKINDLNFDINSIDFIINCVVETKNVKLMDKSNILFLKKIIDLFADGSKNHFTLIHFSTIGIFSQNNSKYINQDSIAKPSNYYEKTKNESEKLIKYYSEKLNNMSYFIFRLGIVYGPTIDNNIINGFIKLAKNKTLFRVKDTFCPFIDIRDVVKFIELCFQNKILKNNSYILTENYQLDHIIDALKNKFIQKQRIITLNKFILFIIFKFLSFFSNKINIQQYIFFSSSKIFYDNRISGYSKNLKKYNLIEYIKNELNNEK